MRVAAKFNLVVIIVLVTGFIVTGFFSWQILQRNARNEVVDRARIMMQAALAVRGYTVNEVRPLLKAGMRHRFLPQTVPAYAATQSFDALRETYPEYAYKEATLNPTNPRDRAVDWEADIVEHFRNHEDNKEIIGTRDTPTGASLYLAHPIRIKDKACLTCHSTPQAAPKTMLAKYGDANGFGWQLNEVVGAQVVSVPMSVPVQQARDAFMVFMGSLAVVFVFILVALNILLKKVVLEPIREMATIADRLSLGEDNVPELKVQGEDEVGILAASFNRMRRSLEKAMQMIGE